MKQPPEKPSSSLLPFILGAIERNLSNLALGECTLHPSSPPAGQI